MKAGPRAAAWTQRPKAGGLGDGPENDPDHGGRSGNLFHSRVHPHSFFPFSQRVSPALGAPQDSHHLLATACVDCCVCYTRTPFSGEGVSKITLIFQEKQEFIFKVGVTCVSRVVLRRDLCLPWAPSSGRGENGGDWGGRRGSRGRSSWSCTDPDGVRTITAISLPRAIGGASLVQGRGFKPAGHQSRP